MRKGGQSFPATSRFFEPFLHDEFPLLLSDDVVTELLSLPWTKDQEDRLDALLCALIGWWHLRFGGEKSEVLGDDSSGHILLPGEG